jgi:hypothetical protein
MSLIRWRLVAFSFKDMTQMPTTVAADNLRSRHAEVAVGVSGHRARDGVKVRRPAAAGLEFVVGFV